MSIFNHAISKFCADFPRQLDSLSAELTPLVGGEAADPTALDFAKQEAHRIAGTASTVGFQRLGSLAGELESQLRQFQTIAAMDSDRRETLWRKLKETHRALCDEGQGVRPNFSSQWNEATQRLEQPEKLRGSLYPLAGLKILAVDDDLTIRQLLRGILTEAGATIALAENGEGALNILKTERPTLILTDWQMSPISGLELLQLIRNAKTPGKPNTPIVFLTANNQVAHLKEAMSSGVDHFILKPFQADAVVKGVLRAHSKANRATRG